MSRALQLFQKKEILTIPNAISLFRLLLIPVIVWLYCGRQEYGAAVGVILLSGASDIVDGFVARRFHMVSNFGKILDPIADKLTQAAMLLCLLSRYVWMWGLIALFLIREVGMIAMGAVVLKKKDSVNSARWYGKLNTVVLYGVMMLLIVFPTISPTLANVLIALCGGVILLSLLLYARFYFEILHEKKDKRSENLPLSQRKTVL